MLRLSVAGRLLDTECHHFMVDMPVCVCRPCQAALDLPRVHEWVLDLSELSCCSSQGLVDCELIAALLHVLGAPAQVSHRFPLEQAPLAFQALLDRKVMGKALLTMGPASRL